MTTATSTTKPTNSSMRVLGGGGFESTAMSSSFSPAFAWEAASAGWPAFAWEAASAGWPAFAWEAVWTDSSACSLKAAMKGSPGGGGAVPWPRSRLADFGSGVAGGLDSPAFAWEAASAGSAAWDGWSGPFCCAWPARPDCSAGPGFSVGSAFLPSSSLCSLAMLPSGIGPGSEVGGARSTGGGAAAAGSLPMSSSMKDSMLCCESSEIFWNSTPMPGAEPSTLIGSNFLVQRTSPCSTSTGPRPVSNSSRTRWPWFSGRLERRKMPPLLTLPANTSMAVSSSGTTTLTGLKKSTRRWRRLSSGCRRSVFDFGRLGSSAMRPW